MDDQQKKLSVLGASVAILSIVINRRKKRRMKQKKKRIWTRPWITLRPQYGAYHCLLKELRLGDRPSYKNFLRMDEATFNELLEKAIVPITQSIVQFFLEAMCR